LESIICSGDHPGFTPLLVVTSDEAVMARLRYYWVPAPVTDAMVPPGAGWSQRDISKI